MGIEDYKFTGGGVICANTDGDGDITISTYADDTDAYFTKADIIAMAKAVGITNQDIKG